MTSLRVYGRQGGRGPSIHLPDQRGEREEGTISPFQLSIIVHSGPRKSAMWTQTLTGSGHAVMSVSSGQTAAVAVLRTIYIAQCGIVSYSLDQTF